MLCPAELPGHFFDLIRQSMNALSNLTNTDRSKNASENAFTGRKVQTFIMCGSKTTAIRTEAHNQAIAVETV